MLSQELLDSLQQHDAQIQTSSDGTIFAESFGNPASEAAAMATSAVVCPVHDMIHIVATGKDRAKFLHNFCTNNIKAMQPGDVCEAFFTDVKAKILAHGYVLATETSLHIMMLPGNQNAILKHLNRYIITEDVCIEPMESPWTTLAIIGPSALGIINTVGVPLPSNTTSGCTSGDAAILMTSVWNDAPVVFLSVDAVAAAETWEKLVSAGATPAGRLAFEHQRIMEGFPRVGIDVTDANLAPEADRVAQAICYTKGFYLGQEPIARLDAMGHVNRKLYRGTASSTSLPEADTDLPLVTSASRISDFDFPVLVQLKVAAATSTNPIVARCSDGTCVELKIT